MPGIAPGGANRVFIPTSFEGGDNPVATAKVQLNGHDRFAEMDGRYFNLKSIGLKSKNLLVVVLFLIQLRQYQIAGKFLFIYNKSKLVDLNNQQGSSLIENLQRLNGIGFGISKLKI
jgi:hypothetical protein